MESAGIEPRTSLSNVIFAKHQTAVKAKSGSRITSVCKSEILTAWDSSHPSFISCLFVATQTVKKRAKCFWLIWVQLKKLDFKVKLLLKFLIKRPTEKKFFLIQKNYFTSLWLKGFFGIGWNGFEPEWDSDFKSHGRFQLNRNFYKTIVGSSLVNFQLKFS